MSRAAPGLRRVAAVQGAYWLVSGLWPIAHLTSFMAVTGRKREGWLVKTTGALIAVIGGTLLAAARSGRVTPEIRQLGVGSAAALAAVEVVYTAKRRIAPIYLADATLELALGTAWLLAHRQPSARRRRTGAVQRGGRFHIQPGESSTADGDLDKVMEASMESFPASDPPGYWR